jgi:hypothetical protein
LPGILNHPFLTDTILSLSLEGAIWAHPTMVDKYSQDADIHRAVRDMLDHEKQSIGSNQVLGKLRETGGRDDSNPISAGNNSRKRLRVGEESSPTAHSDPSTSSISAQGSARVVSE